MGTPLVDLIAALGATSHWRLGEAFGSATGNDEISTNDATYVNGPRLGVQSDCLMDPSTGVYLGGGQWATVADNAALDLGDTFSIWFRFRRGRIGLNQTVLDKGTTGGTGYLVYWNASNRCRLATSGAGVAIVEGPVTTDTRSWHTMCFTKATSTTLCYYDGVDSSTAGTPATLADTTNNLVLGAEVALTNRTNGWLADIALFKSIALTAQNVRDLHNTAAYTRGGVGMLAGIDSARLVAA